MTTKICRRLSVPDQVGQEQEEYSNHATRNTSFPGHLNGESYLYETGRLAGQAGGAVTLRMGDTMVFAAATMSDQVRAGIDFFPLTWIMKSVCTPVDVYRAHSSVVKEDPGEEAILTARLTDRPLRPLFRKICAMTFR